MAQGPPSEARRSARSRARTADAPRGSTRTASSSGTRGRPSPGRGGAAAVTALLATLLLGGLAGVAGGSDPVSQGSEGTGEYELKAALIYKFVKYVEWPDEKLPPGESPIVIGVFGSDPFRSVLERTFEGKKSGDHPFQLRRFESLASVPGCHIVFLPRTEDDWAERVAAAAKGAGVLVIGESEGFARRGGIINFYLHEKKHVRFEINPKAARRQGIEISSQLLKLARIVEA